MTKEKTLEEKMDILFQKINIDIRETERCIQELQDIRREYYNERNLYDKS